MIKKISSIKKPGFSGIGFICFLFIFFIITFITMEYYHIFTLKESVETEISRALNISVITATQDIDWINHDSVMDVDIAEKEFMKYLKNEMGLNNSYEKYDSSGEFEYQIIIEDSELQSSPAKYTVSGQIRMRPATVRNILPERFDIPFKQSSSNIRTDN